MILITGANGHLGSGIIDFLLKRGYAEKIAGLVRSEEKGKELESKGVEPRIGDYSDYDSMQRAVRGIDILLLISSSTIVDRVRQHKHALNTAQAAGVKHVFYTSMVQADRLLSPLTHDHNETEKHIKTLGIAYTIYRHTFYLDFFPLYLGNALESGEWNFPSGGRKINFALRSEMAEALANGLSDTGEHRNKVYEITSSESYTLPEYAEMLSEAVGKKISCNDIPVGVFKERLVRAGLPEAIVALSVLTAETFVNGALDIVSGDLENLLGRKPADIKSFLKGEEFSSYLARKDAERY